MYVLHEHRKRTHTHLSGVQVLFSSCVNTHLKFLNKKKLFVVTQALLEAGFDLPARFATTSQCECFSTNIAANNHFCSLVFQHVSSPPPHYCGREERFLEL